MVSPMTRTTPSSLASVGLAIALGAGLGRSTLRSASAAAKPTTEPGPSPAASAETPSLVASHRAYVDASQSQSQAPIVDRKCFDDCMKSVRKALRRCAERHCPFPPGEELEACKDEHCADEIEQLVTKWEECEGKCDIVCSS